jgi:hypothetical protein
VDAGAFKSAPADGKLQDAMEHKTTVDIITVNLYMRCLKAIFGRAVKDDLLLFNPFDRAVSIVKKSQSWHYVTAAEFKKMIDAASPKMGLLIALCRLAGLRAGEAFIPDMARYRLCKQPFDNTGQNRLAAKGQRQPSYPDCA